MTITDFLYSDHPRGPRRLAVILLPLVTGIVLAAVGAFGSYMSMGLPVRLVHFAVNTLVIGALTAVVTGLVRRFLFAGAGPPLWAAIVIAFAMAPPGAWIVLLLLRLWAPHVLPYISYAEIASQVLLINLFISTVIWALRRMPVAGETALPGSPPAEAAGPADEPDALRSRLPVALRSAAIRSLSAEDHYIRVRTDRGQALILMNLSHAIDALGANSGVRIHRSHWVADDVALKEGARLSRLGIRIDETTVLPISRSGRKLLLGFNHGRENAEAPIASDAYERTNRPSPFSLR